MVSGGLLGQISGKLPTPQLWINDQPVLFQDSVSITQLSYILADDKEQYTVEEIEEMDVASNFQTYDSHEPIINTKGTHWLSMTCNNPDSVSHEWVLFFGYEHHVEVYGLGEPKLVGTMIPQKYQHGRYEPGFFLRDEGHSSQVILSLKAGETRQVFIKTKRLLNKPLAENIKLFEPAYWKNLTEPGFRHFREGVFQGIIWALILYHLLMVLMVRDITYFYYSMYMVCISALTLGDFGYWQGYIFPNQPYLAWCIFQFLQYWTGIMTLIFMRSFVRLDKILPKWDKRVRNFIWANVAILAIISMTYLPTQEYQIVIYAKFLILPFVIAGLVFCYLLLRSRDTVALYFAGAGILLALIIGVNGLLELQEANNYLLETPYKRFYIIQLAVVVHLLTFSLGMGYRRRQKDQESQRSKEIDNLKTRLYTNITHEFRTPLTVIIGMNEQIQGNEKAKDLIERNSQNLLRLINQMLDLSKLESGNLKLEMAQGDIVKYLDYLTESFYSLAAERDIQLTFYSEMDTLLMDFDEKKIQHIVYNLLSNAIKFTPKEGKVILHLSEKEQEGEACLQLKIKDTGIGISPRQLPRIFDRFYQVDNSHTRKGEGTGIGLSLTKELVAVMDGTIAVSSQQGKGTEFVILLPIKKESGISQSLDYQDVHLSSLSSFSTEQISASDQPSNLSQLLLIEDNPDVATYIQSLLEDSFEVLTAVNGQDGIERAIESIPDIIISDVMMPLKDGYQVTQTLKYDERTSHIPIILLTAKAAEKDRLDGLRYGADAYLTKPFNKEELFIRLEKLVESRKSIQRYFAQAITQPDALGETSPESSMTPSQEAFIAKLKAAVIDRLDDSEFTVPDLIEAGGMSHTQIYRKLKAISDQTPSQFIRSVRLAEGLKMLNSTDLNISEVAYSVGFSDPNYFSRTFQQMYGKSPREMRK